MQIAGFCARDTEFSAILGVSLRAVVRNEGVLCSRYRFFCRFGCVAAGGGADCGVLRLRHRVFRDLGCVAAVGGADCGVLCLRYRVFCDLGCVAAVGRVE